MLQSISTFVTSLYKTGSCQASVKKEAIIDFHIYVLHNVHVDISTPHVCLCMYLWVLCALIQAVELTNSVVSHPVSHACPAQWGSYQPLLETVMSYDTGYIQ